MSGKPVLVVGAGMGGLSAALSLARHGFRVRLLEARAESGGLASGFQAEDFAFDGGPYVLLDRPGLEWAFRALGLELADHLDLVRVEDVYEVASDDGPRLRFRASLAETADGFERLFPGNGRRYQEFVTASAARYRRLQPLLRISRPGPLSLLRAGAWRDGAFLLRPLHAALSRSGLPRPILEALSIWTHVAGQSPAQAPSLLAFVPALIHEFGAFYVGGGIRSVPQALARAVATAGVEIEHGTKVKAIVALDGRAAGVETADGRFLEADAVVSGAGGLSTCLEMIPALPARAREALERLPLQSPGVAAYLAARGPIEGPYLRFHLPRGGGCRLWIRPATVDAQVRRGEWWPARLLSPMSHEEAERTGEAGQRAHLDRLLGEPWWREGLAETRVLRTRVPVEWGADYHLHRDSMNPVMTARFMRAGRLPHRSPYLKGLYLAGSATHPGQWVSFCAISGVLAADCVRRDLA